MAPPKAQQTINKQKKQTKLQQYTKYVNLSFIKYLILDPAALPIVSVLILFGELVVNLIVVQRVPYTEIDWIAYMQECEGFLNGTTNYELLRGDTGPLVYPAAFVYIYSILYFITSHGENIRLAQYIFLSIYLLQMWLVLRLYTKSRKVPPYVLIISAFTSYRIHSIYVLRLFNDPIAILFLYISLNLFLDRHWSAGSFCFSLAVGVKMNILLFAPALLLFYLTNLGYLKTFIQLSICGIIQLLLGAPFLLTYPLQYIRGSFDLARIFEHKWTVNYRFLAKPLFMNKLFHLSLLATHLILLVIFARPAYKFFKNYARLRELQNQLQPQIEHKNEEIKNIKNHKGTAKNKKFPNINNEKTVKEKFTPDQEAFLKSFEKSLQKSTGLKSPQPKQDQKHQTETMQTEKVSIHFDQCTQLAILPLFLCNFIGLVCARSLHYQFYVWYFHSLPYLTWSTDYSLGLRFLILGVIEFCWNTYPSTNFSSYLLHLSHFVLLFGVGRNIFKTMGQSASLAAAQQNVQKKEKEGNANIQKAARNGIEKINIEGNNKMKRN